LCTGSWSLGVYAGVAGWTGNKSQYHRCLGLVGKRFIPFDNPRSLSSSPERLTTTLQQLEELAEKTSHEDRVIPVESVEMYEIIAEMGPDTLCREEAMVSTKYKTVEKKVKPAAGPLPADSEQKGKKFREIRHSGRPWISGIPSGMRLAVNFGLEEADSSCRKKKNDSGRC
jgi:hypothetical protein